MIRTPLCESLDIAYPIVLGGMPVTFNSTALAGAVSEAGGLGILGVTRMDRHAIDRCTSAVRAETSKPFGLDLLMFLSDEAALAGRTGRGTLASTAKSLRRTLDGA